MEITGLHKAKRGGWNVYADGQFAGALHEETLAASGLAAGGEVSSEQLEELLGASREKFAREMALRLLARRAYTCAELRAKVAEKWGEAEAESAVLRMRELGLVDDLDYARRFIADAVHLRGQGKLRAARALAEKGVEREIIEAVAAERYADPEPLIAELLLRKYRRLLGDEAGRNKAVQALARLGWRGGDIRSALRNVCEDEHYYADRHLE